MDHRIFLGLGTNLGDRLANLEAAREGLEPRVHVLAVSPIYQTAPWGYTDQPDFLNQVLQAETDLSPHELLVTLKELEMELGRKATFRYGPRVIDLDILFYDDLQLSTPELTIPHGRVAERAFMLVPLAALAPDLVHGPSGKTIRQLLQEIDTQGVNLFDPSSGDCCAGQNIKQG